MSMDEDLSRFFISKKLGSLRGKALVRVDINSPVKDGKVGNNLRLRSCAKSIETYVKNGIIPIILCHQGRKGDDDYLESMEQHARIIESLTTGVNVKYSNSLTDEATTVAVAKLKQGDALLLKNVRDHEDEKAKFKSPEEMANSGMVRFLSRLADFYINDAPATMHRSDTSLIGFVSVMPSYLGLQMEDELKALQDISSRIKSGNNVVLIFGGKKWEKFEYIYEIAKNKNVRILCGGIPGQSICYVTNKGSFNEQNEKYILETGSLDTAEKLVREFSDRVISPVDFVLEDRENVPIAELKSRKGNIADIGEETLNRFFKAIDGADMIVYAGPVGRYEKGYNQTVRVITRFMGERATSYTFGGNSADSIDDIGLDRAYELLGGKTITSGGAALAYVAGKELPVLSAFRNRK
jgi:phosphoglycerate kinase